MNAHLPSTSLIEIMSIRLGVGLCAELEMRRVRTPTTTAKAADSSTIRQSQTGRITKLGTICHYMNHSAAGGANIASHEHMQEDAASADRTTRL